MAGSHEIAPEVHDGVSTLDEPSAAWGWHGLSKTSIQLAGWASVLFMLGFLFGNHEGHVETIWLLAIAAVMAIGLVIHLFEPKLNQVRTLTARNKPVGHQEPEWAYLQKTLQGPYAELTDSQLRAHNIEPARVQHLRQLPEDSTGADITSSTTIEAGSARTKPAGSTRTD